MLTLSQTIEECSPHYLNVKKQNALLLPSYCHGNDAVKVHMSGVMKTPTFWFPTWSGANQAVQSQKMARDLKIQI